MASLVTLASLRGQALLRADAVNDPFFSVAEVNQYLNNSYAELYDLLSAPVESDFNVQQYFFRTGQANQSVGVGGAGVLSFGATLAGAAIVPGSLSILNNALSATDNGGGTIVTAPNAGCTGTINYSTGALALTFTQAPEAGSVISATYLGQIAGTDTYALPSNFFKSRGVDIQLSGTLGQNGGTARYYPVRSFMFAERNNQQFPIGNAFMGARAIQYRIQGRVLKLIPSPNISQLTFRLWFIPAYTPMVNDADTIDGVDGWEEYVITDCIIKMQSKQEADTGPWDMAKAALVRRIEAMTDRDAGNPQRISDTVQGQDSDGGPAAIGGLPV